MSGIRLGSGKGGSTLRSKVLLFGLLAAVAFATTAWAFDAYISDASGNPKYLIYEGERIYVAINDPEKGACGIDSFTADVLIFDFKTGAYLQLESVNFNELTAGSGIYLWDQSAVKVGDRLNWTPTAVEWDIGGQTITEQQALGFEHWTGGSWTEGNWEYIDEYFAAFGDGDAERVQFTGVDYRDRDIAGRFENMDTLVLLVKDNTDGRNIDTDQTKIADTVATLTVTPKTLNYGCGDICANIIVEINDPDEDLDPSRIDYVPFFVIVNPGSWVPDTGSTAPPPPPPPAPPTAAAAYAPKADGLPAGLDPVTNFCGLMAHGGVNANGDPLSYVYVDEPYKAPIRWYNVYQLRYIDYPDRWLAGGAVIGRVTFYAQETDVDSGLFRFNFGNLDQFQDWLGFDEFPIGTTVAFYYLDPNDFDDFVIDTAQVGERAHSRVELVDSAGVPINREVKIGHEGLYVRVYDADANVNACCQDRVVVHLCDPHNEDDSEYWLIDEVSNDSGIFGSKSGMPLLPVWDAVGGYQLVFDDWKFQAFNEDTVYVRYNSVNYRTEDLLALGDGIVGYPDAVTGAYFPPVVIEGDDRYQPWDVSFDQVKVYDTQVFDGSSHSMWFLDGTYTPVTEIPVSGSLYLKVEDLDQNENPLMNEWIFGGWHKEAADRDSAPVWGHVDARGNLLGLAANSISGVARTSKVFIFNAQKHTWEQIDLRETGPDTGVFQSTTCVEVAGGEGTLESTPEDTIVAFYQDPSNHSDIATIQIKVSQGGEAGTTKPAPSVRFDQGTYQAGDTVVITVTDPVYALAGEISGANVLVLKLDDMTLTSWNSLPAIGGGEFQVTYQLPEDLASGTLTAEYTDPTDASRKATATAQVLAAELSDVTDVRPVPEVLVDQVAFTIYAEPEGAVADSIEIAIYDLTGRKVAELSGTGTASVTWDGDALRNGAYIYVAVVEGAGKTWTFRGFVYIKR